MYAPFPATQVLLSKVKVIMVTSINCYVFVNLDLSAWKQTVMVLLIFFTHTKLLHKLLVANQSIEISSLEYCISIEESLLKRLGGTNEVCSIYMSLSSSHSLIHFPCIILSWSFRGMTSMAALSKQPTHHLLGSYHNDILPIMSNQC